MEFEFNQQLMPQNLLSVEQLGQCAIEGTNDDGYYYYLIIRTTLGICTIAECGPVVPDVVMLPDSFTTKLSRLKCDEKKLTSFINRWLNDRSKLLTDAKCISVEDALSQFRDLKEYMENYSEEVY